MNEKVLNKKNRIIKLGDIFVIIFIIALSITILFATKKGGFEEGSIVNIKVDGEIIKSIKIDGKMTGHIEHIHSEFGENDIEITKHGVKMYKSDCKDKLCIKMGEITNKGESIVCLPNRLVVEIEPGSDGLDVMLH